MSGTQSFMDLLSTNLAYVFHQYFFVKNKQTCSHKLSSNKNLLSPNPVKKVRINMNKYGHLFNSIITQEINNNKVRKKTNLSKKMNKKDNQRRKKNTKIKSKKASIPQETIIIPPSTSNSSNEIKTQLSEDPTLKTEDHQSSEINRESSSSTSLTLSEIRLLGHETDSTSHVLDQRREKMNSPVNRNYINTRNLSDESNLINTLQDKKMKQYSQELKPEQLFCCAKDSRSKGRKCCGVYYELFDDAWRLLEGWFRTE